MKHFLVALLAVLVVTLSPRISHAAITSVSLNGFTDGGGTAPTSATVVGAGQCRTLNIQADPGNSTVNISVGYTATPTVVLIAGASVTLYPGDLSQVYVKAASATPTFHFSCSNITHP